MFAIYSRNGRLTGFVKVDTRRLIVRPINLLNLTQDELGYARLYEMSAQVMTPNQQLGAYARALEKVRIEPHFHLVRHGASSLRFGACARALLRRRRTGSA